MKEFCPDCQGPMKEIERPYPPPPDKMQIMATLWQCENKKCECQLLTHEQEMEINRKLNDTGSKPVKEDK